MGVSRKISRFGCARFVTKLVLVFAKLFTVTLPVVFLWKLILILGSDNNKNGTSPSEDFEGVQNMLDVRSGNVYAWSNNMSYGSAIISLFKQSSAKVTAISITTAITVIGKNDARVVKNGNHLTITTKEASLKIVQYAREKLRCINLVEETEPTKRSAKDQEKEYQPSHNLDVGGALFYGGAEMVYQQWPLNYGELMMLPFVASDESDNGGFGNVLERYWLTSDGAAIFVDHATPLHVGYGQSAIRFKAVRSNNYGSTSLRSTLRLNYTVCLGRDIRSTHISLLGRLWSFPKDIPDILTFNHPIWSTKVRYQKNFNQQDILIFVKEITSRNFTVSQLELDQVFSSNYGDWKWDITKFPKVRDTIMEIRKSISCITISISPFINEDSDSYETAFNLGIFVNDDKLKAAEIKWSGGTGSHIDFTSNAATQYFINSLSSLKENGIDAYVFDGGMPYYLPEKFATLKPITNPMGMCTNLVKAVRNKTTNKIMVRCGYQTQEVDVFIKTLPRESTWDNEGLKSIIPTILQYGIIGYIFSVPDVIGGNGFTKDEGTIVSGRLPDRELYIRWCQLVAFLPVMQFSVAPWDYDDEVITIALKFIKLHDEYVTPKVIPLAHDSIQNGHPIIRPLWWVDPSDPKTFDVDSQFMIGDGVLVAPVLTKGQNSREIYLPKGQWKDMNYRKIFDGPITITDFLAPLNVIPYFERIK